MYLLYVDDSGLPTDKKCRHCVLGGYAIYESKTYFLQQEIDALIERHFGRINIELHSNQMRTGKGEWRNFSKAVRDAIMTDVLQCIASHYPRDVILFGVVLDKDKRQELPLPEALFTQITSRFDMFLQRKFRQSNIHARGIAVFDKSTSEGQFQALSKVFQQTGNHWGNTLNNFSEVPLFLDSKMSRHIQLADIIAYALFRKFEHDDDRYFSIIEHCFDRDGPNHYGLYVQ
jgi:hypothetical protein